MDAIRENFEQTHKCNLQLARGTFFPHNAVFGLQKGSRYTSTMTKGYHKISDYKKNVRIHKFFFPFHLFKKVFLNFKKMDFSTTGTYGFARCLTNAMAKLQILMLVKIADSPLKS